MVRFIAILLVVLIGFVLDSAGQIDMKILDQRFETSSKKADEFLRLGRQQLEASNFKLAIDAFERAISMDPKLAEGHAWLAVAYARSSVGDTAQTRLMELAMSHIHQAMTLAPEDPQIRLLRGVVGLSSLSNGLKEIIADLETVAEGTGPDSIKAEALYYLGVAHRRVGISQWERLITTYPDSPAARKAQRERPK